MIEDKVLIALAVALYLMGGLFLLARRGQNPVSKVAQLVLVVAMLGVIAACVVLGIEMPF